MKNKITNLKQYFGIETEAEQSQREEYEAKQQLFMKSLPSINDAPDRMPLGEK